MDTEARFGNEAYDVSDSCLNGTNGKNNKNILYAVDEVPSWGVTLFYGVQQAVATAAGGPLIMAYMVWRNICTTDQDDVLYAQLVASTVFLCGVVTIVQIVAGVRLPIRQASSWTFVAPIAAMMSTEQWRCPVTQYDANATEWLSSNMTNGTYEPPWLPRLKMINGGLIMASLVQTILGLTGMVGFIMSYIGPLTVIPTVSMIGLSLYHNLVIAAASHWGITAMSFAIFLILTLFLSKVNMPYPCYSKVNGCHFDWYPVFKVFPLLMTLSISWLVCYILTVSGVFPDDPSHPKYMARTDAKAEVIDKVGWFYVPYPGQWGAPTFGISAFFGMLAATFTSIIESIGDYYATAKVCDVSTPPKHAVNRGITVEGLGGILAGFVGICHNTTSYSDSIALISITGTASRVAWLSMGFMMLVLAVIPKFGAALSTIPDPIMGGAVLPLLAMIAAIALINVKYVDLQSTRNLLVLGLALMLGLAVPDFLKQHPEAINTGNGTVDEVLYVFLSTSMFVAGFVGFVLDNIAPGTKEERGILSFNREMTSNSLPGSSSSIYNIPLIHRCLERCRCFSFVPISSTYKERTCCNCRKRSTPHLDVELSEKYL